MLSPSKVLVPRPISSRMSQAVIRGVADNARDFVHLHHKGALVGDKVIARSYPGKDFIGNGDHGGFCGHETADMRHQRNERYLPHIRAFSRHIRPGNDDRSVVGRIHIAVVRDKLFVRYRLDHGVPSAVMSSVPPLFTISGRA